MPITADRVSFSLSANGPRWAWGAALLSATLLAGCGTATRPPAPQPAPPTAQVNPTDRLGIAYVRIPAGEFMMGSDESPAALAKAFPHADPKRLSDFKDEAPVHRVRLTRDFWMGQHAITVGQFREFLRQSGYVPESVRDGTGAYGFNPDYTPPNNERGDLFEGRLPRYSWDDTGFPQSDQHPVVNVTWNDAVAMARWLTEREGVVYRLPTEAEWEYAARGGARTRYPGGDDPAILPRVANTFDRETALRWPRWREQAGDGNDGYAFTAPVGRFQPNAFGLYDMVGNVWEWCADWYDEDYYARSPVNDPQGPVDGTVKVRRGGSWHSWPLYARTAFRNWNSPSTRYVLVGFRLVRDQAVKPAR